MIDKNMCRTQVIHWDQYQDFELSTADGILIGVVNSVRENAEDGAKYLVVEGSHKDGEEFQVPVGAIGIITGHHLVLDVNADHIEFVDTADGETVEKSSSNGTNGAGQKHQDSNLNGASRRELDPLLFESVTRARREADELRLQTETRPQRAVHWTLESEVSGKTPQSDSPEFAPLRERGARHRTGVSDGRIEISVTRGHRHEEIDPYHETVLQSLNRRTFVLEQLVLDLYLSQNRMDGSSIDSGLLRTQDSDPSVQDTTREEIRALTEEYNEFATRSLAEFDVVYLFAGSVYESLREQAGLPDDFLATWGICADGNQILVHLTSGDNDSWEDWAAHLQSLIDRHLTSPVTVTTDGSPGLIQAVEESFPSAKRIRCWAEKMNAVLDEAPSTIRPGLKLWLQSIRDAPDHSHGEDLAITTVEKFEESYPEAMRAFSQDLQASLSHLSLPVTHRRFVRVATVTERNVMDDRDLSSIPPNLRNQDEGVTCVFGMLWQSSRWWQRLSFTWTEGQQLENL